MGKVPCMLLLVRSRPEPWTQSDNGSDCRRPACLCPSVSCKIWGITSRRYIRGAWRSRGWKMMEAPLGLVLR